MSELLSVARGLKHSYSLSNKQIKYISSHQSPCTLATTILSSNVKKSLIYPLGVGIKDFVDSRIVLMLFNLKQSFWENLHLFKKEEVNGYVDLEVFTGVEDSIQGTR